MKKKKYLSLYKEWMKNGVIPQMETPDTIGGLCSIFYKDRLFKLITPENNGLWYWGYGAEDWTGTDGFTFTPLRQTIVLFLAAMNNEL